ncbi:MAG: NifB/NifX family molybdenum-iron cluster-binding protein [Lachnospiraceae bacterium]
MLFGKRDDRVILQKTPLTEFVAVGYEGGKNIPILEKTDYFMFYTVQKKRMVRKNMLSIQDTKTQSVIRQLKELQVDVVICREVGPMAAHLLKEAGIRCFLFDGSTQAGLQAYLAGKLTSI